VDDAMNTVDDRASKGGKARAEALTPERRTEIARKAAEARARQLQPSEKAALPHATHEGPLRISEDFILPSAVLSDADHTRVIAENAVARQLGRGLGGKSLRLAARDQGEPLPAYLTKTVEPFVTESLRNALNRPIVFRGKGGVRRGIPASLLPEICEVWLRANDAGALQASQYEIARKALALTRALATVGIIALVDEATGYQEVRERNELQRILSAYVNPIYLPWTKRFPDEFYEELFRLKNWPYNPISVKRPQVVGKLTDKLIYEKLPEGVLLELRSKNPTDERGRRRHKHHQFLTDDIGNPHLERHMAAVVALMKAADNWPRFMKLFDRAFSPRPKHTQKHLPGLEMPDEDDEE
jgi:P63C domain-containing protein